MFDPEKVQIGDVIEFWVPRYQHCAAVKVTKINKKSFVGTEIRGSYRSGQSWYVHKETEGLRMSHRKEK